MIEKEMELARQEHQAWQDVCAAMWAAGLDKKIGSHSATCECCEVCRLFRAVEKWGDRLARLRAFQAEFGMFSPERGWIGRGT